MLLIATGGTIASKRSHSGLKPQITPEELKQAYFDKFEKNLGRW